MMLRRLRRMMVVPEAIVSMLWPGSFRYIVEGGLPVNARVVGLSIDSARNQISILLECPDWDEVVVGSIIPELEPIVVSKVREPDASRTA